MKTIRNIITGFLVLIGIASLYIIIQESYYFQEILGNVKQTKDTYPDEKSTETQKQIFELGEKYITKSNYYALSTKDIINNPLMLFVLTGKISYRLFLQNLSFNSFLSPQKYQFIDSSSALSKQDTFDCIKIVNFKQNESKEEKCKYIVFSEQNYPELRLEIYSLDGTGSLIKFENIQN